MAAPEPYINAQCLWNCAAHGRRAHRDARSTGFVVCMFATSYIPSIRTGSVGVSLLQVHKAGGLPGPIVGHYWLKSPLAQHRLPALRPSCTSRDKADHSGTYEEPLGLNLRSEQVPREPYLEVGSIITTHGVRGEVKVQALTDFPRERLLTPGIR